MKRKIIKQSHRKAITQYVNAFCAQMETEFEYWADNYHIANIGDYFVGIDDIIYMVDNNVSYNVFTDWYEDSMKNFARNGKTYPMEVYIKIKQSGANLAIPDHNLN